MGEIIKAPLPELPFGNKTAIIDLSARNMSERIRSAMPFKVEYDALGDGKVFEHRASAVNINGMKVAASASTPTRIQIQEVNIISLFIPFAGKSTRSHDGKVYTWQAGDKACFTPKGDGVGEGSTRSIMMLEIDPIRLTQAAGAILGNAANDLPRLDFERIQLLDMATGGMSFQSVFWKLAKMIDDYQDQPHLLNLSGLDDAFYRHTAMMMPGFLLTLENSKNTTSIQIHKLSEICEYIVANLDKRLTLTVLELASGLSGRDLQYSFLKIFECSPMQWIKMARLDLAHRRLIHAQFGDTVTSVALTSGFTNLGMFSNLYQQRFQQFPSVTLKYGLRRKLN